MNALKPHGIFSVSRWYSPGRASETSRLLALATATLLDRGISNPAEHIALVSSGSVATLLVSNQALAAEDLKVLAETASIYGFTVLLAPGSPPADPLLGAIVSSRSRNQLMGRRSATVRIMITSVLSIMPVPAPHRSQM